MDEVVYYNSLYDLYGSLLTEKQKKYFEDYYFCNLSYSEMAENYGISRNAAFKHVHIVVCKLEEYESKLGLYQKRQVLLEIASKITNNEVKEKLENLI